MGNDFDIHPAWYQEASRAGASGTFKRGKSPEISSNVFFWYRALLIFLFVWLVSLQMVTYVTVSETKPSPTPVTKKQDFQLQEKVTHITEVLKFLIEESKKKAVHNKKEPIQPRQVAYVTASKANLRDAPSLDSRIVTTVTKDSELLVQGQKGDWLMVSSPKEKNAWISDSVVSTYFVP